MSVWIPAIGDVLPSEPGWYPTLSNWRTASLHPGAKQWLGSKWASLAPERIESFSLERFDCPLLATGRAFDLDCAVVEPANANFEMPESLAAAAG